MAKTPNKPTTNAVGATYSKKPAHAEQGQGFARMKVGSPSNLGARKGTFKGTASDLRTTKGKFQSGLKGVGMAGGQHGAGHAKQPGGHASLAKGPKF